MKKALIIILLVIVVVGSLLPISRYMIQMGFTKYQKPWAADFVVTGARLQMYMMRYAEARPTFEKVLSVFPNYLRRDRVHFNVAFCYEKEGNDKMAIEWYNRFLAQWPKHPWADQVRHRVADIEANAM